MQKSSPPIASSSLRAFLLLLILSLQVSSAQIAQGPASGSIAGGVRVSTNDNRLLRTTPSISSLRAGPPAKKRPSAGALPLNHPRATAPEGSNYQVDSSTEYARTTSPIILASYQGIQQTAYIPPDPVIAAGPNNVLEAVNSTFSISDKSGNLIKSIDAGKWFETTLPGANPFDPRVQYDHFAGRWVMLWHHQANNPPSSYYLLSVSDGEDPLGSWSNWALPANANGNTPTDNWADNGCLGFDRDALYIVSNQFFFSDESFDYVKLRIVPKAQLLGKRADGISWTDFWDIFDSLHRKAYAIRPTIVHGLSSAYYLLEIPDVIEGTYGVVYKITDPIGNPSLTEVEVPLTDWTQPPDAGQPGGGKAIDTPGSTLTSEAQYMEGSIWAVHSAENPFWPQYSCIRYLRIDVMNNLALEDVTFGAKGYWFIYPAIVVDKDMNMVITFSRSGDDEYVGAHMTWSLRGESALHPSVTIQPGWAHYEKIDPDGYNRWGDYSGAALDPTDMNNFWLAAQYAETPASTWGVWVMKARLVPFTSARAAISTPIIDFGYSDIGRRSDTLAVVITNTGTTQLTISSASHISPNFTLVNSPFLPATLGTYDSLKLSLVFTPYTIGPVLDTLVVVSNDSTSASSRIALTGTGVEIAPAVPGIIYAIQSNRMGSSLIRLNSLDATVTPIGSSDTLSISAITIRPSNNQIYAVAPALKGAWLLRADSKSGRFYTVRRLSVPDITAIAFNHGDALFAGTAAGDMYRINASNGLEERIGNAPGMNYTGLSFGPISGRLWASTTSPYDNDTLYTVDLLRGSVTPVGTTGFGVGISSISFDQKGTLFCLAENALVTVDTLTGRGSLIARFGVEGLRAIALNSSSSTTEASKSSGPGLTFRLDQNYPNPFNPSTTISYSLQKTSYVSLRIFNALGQEVTCLVKEQKGAGSYQVQWNANVSSGIYLYRFQAGEYVETKKMIVLR